MDETAVGELYFLVRNIPFIRPSYGMTPSARRSQRGRFCHREVRGSIVMFFFQPR